jgi:hypothetical protein
MAGNSRGRDGPAYPGYVAVHGFMMQDLGLSGLPLLVYARIYGFNASGLEFYESKAHLAAFLGTTERSVYRALSQLIGDGLVTESGEHVPRRGHRTKVYSVVTAKLPPGAPLAKRHDMPSGVPPPKHDETSSPAPGIHDGVSGKGMTICHPIRKRDNEDFR